MDTKATVSFSVLTFGRGLVSKLSFSSEAPNAGQHAAQGALEQARQRAAEPSVAAEQAGEQRAPQETSEPSEAEKEAPEHDCSADTENWMETWSLEKCLSRLRDWAWGGLYL